MNFDAVGNIQNITARMNQIESRINNIGTQQAPSFDAILQNTMQARMPSAMMNGGLPPSLQMLNYQGLGEASWLANMAKSDPTKVVTYKDFKMQAQTAERYAKLEQLVEKRFPGRQVILTSTMDGKHLDPNHPAGKAIDFVVDGMTKAESRDLESLCWQAGLKPYNEYINGSTYKTGDHMHVDLIEG